LVDDDILLGAHILTHVAFFLAFAVHVGLVLKHQFVDRDNLLRRML
jgi:cytochrome b561